MNSHSAIGLCLELMRTVASVSLSTVGEDGFPRTRAMLNLRNAQKLPALVPLFVPLDKTLTVYFRTNTGSRKIEQIRKNPKGCAYYCDNGGFRAALLTGNLEVVEDADVKDALREMEWSQYYPEGVYSPQSSIIKLTPTMLTAYTSLSITDVPLGE